MGMTPQPGIMDIKLYQSGAATIEGVSEVVKLSSNENPHGPSKRALDAFRQAAGNLHVYPSTDHLALREAIGEVQGMDVARIMCGVGSDEVISFLCYAFAGPGDEVLYTEHGFSMYRISALAAGATPVVAPETERVCDVDKLLAAVTDATRLVFIANPNNPTGTMISDDEVARLAEGLPEGCLLVLDGATLNRLRGPFNLSAPALTAAEVAMRDVGYTDWCRAENARMRQWMVETIRGLGIPCDASEANFVVPRFESAAQAEAVDAHLKTKGLIVRMIAGYGLPEALRITVGTEADCKRVIAAIKEAI